MYPYPWTSKTRLDYGGDVSISILNYYLESRNAKSWVKDVTQGFAQVKRQAYVVQSYTYCSALNSTLNHNLFGVSAVISLELQMGK